MTKLKLNNLDIFKGEGDLFLTNGDHYLLRIAGDDCFILELILKGFDTPSDIESVYTKVQNQIEKDKFTNLVNWLMRNGILVQENDVPIDQVCKTRKITIWSDFENPDLFKSSFVSKLHSDYNHYELNKLIYNNITTESVIGSDLVIILSPIFSNYGEFQKLNETCYKLGIPALHVGIGMSFFTIGPFSVPQHYTSCLKCYSRRKMINFDNKDKYLKFIQLNNQTLIKNNQIFSNYYLGVMLEFLKVELDNYFSRGSMYLFSKSITVDMLGYNISESKVLRIPYCEVCDESTVVSPLN